MNFAAAFDYVEDAAETTATRVAEACLSPISFRPPTPEEKWWGHAGSMLDDAFCLSPEPDELAAAQAEIEQLRADNARLRTTEHQLRLMNVALGEAFQRQKERAEETEADLERLRDYADKMEDEFERVRDRALGIIVSRTAEVDRLKKELAAAKKPVLRADAPPFVPSTAAKLQTLKEVVLARLREKGYTPYTA
jgi:hypothetical protein